MSVHETAQVTFKRFRVETVLGRKLDDFVAAPKALGYRHSAKRVVGGRRGDLRLGSYTRGSHRVADMRGCRVDHPKIVAALDQLVAEANHLEIEAYRDAPGDGRPASGDLRYVWAKCDGDPDDPRVLLTLVTGDSHSQAAQRLAPRLTEAHAVAWSVQSGSHNALRGGPPVALRGPQRLETSLMGPRTEVGPLGFLQPNPQVAGMAYQALLSDPAGVAVQGKAAFDLYAGAGVTTALLRQRFERVTPCESYEASARALGVEPRVVSEFLAQAVRDPTQIQGLDLVVSNPPRGGMGAPTCAALCELGAPRLHIMSCNPQTLARDLEALASRYEVLAVRAFDTLPQTAHVECVAWLRRR